MEKTMEEWRQEFESGKSLKSVPLSERTKDICLAAIETGHGSVWGLRFLPSALSLDQDIWDAAYASGIGFGHVPEACRSKDMCAKAVAAWPLNLRFVPEELKTPELCQNAFARDARACFFVPKGMETDAMRTACTDLRNEWEKATANAEAPDEPDEEGVAAGGHVKVRQVAFLDPGTRFPRYGECEEEVQNQAELEPDDIIVTEWGNPKWQYEVIRHAVMPDDFDGDESFNPYDFEWDKGVDYAWNGVAGVFWRNPADCRKVADTVVSKDASEEEAEAATMEQMSGFWAEVSDVDMFPLKFGDLWHAFGHGTGNALLFDLYEGWGMTMLLRDALLWANAGKEGFTPGKAEVLAHLALDDLDDDETDLEAWFADELGADAWMDICNGGRYSGWICEDEESGGTAMSIRKDSADPDEKQLFEDVLPWGAIATAIHYGDYNSQDGREMNSYLYDDFASWGIAAPMRGIYFNEDKDNNEDNNFNEDNDENNFEETCNNYENNDNKIFLDKIINIKNIFPDNIRKIRFMKSSESFDALNEYINNPEKFNTVDLFYKFNKKELFNVGDIVLGFLRIENDIWILTTAKKVINVLGITNGQNYEGEEIEELKPFFGRLKIFYHNKVQTLVRYYDGLCDEIVVHSILPEKFNG